MTKFQHKLALAAVISFCGLGAIAASPAHSASLLLGLQENLQNYHLVSKQDRANNLTSLSRAISIVGKLDRMSEKSKSGHLSSTKSSDSKDTTELKAVNAIDNDYAQIFLEEELEQTKEQLKETLTDSLYNLSTNEEINQYMKEYIKNGYYGLTEEDTKQMSDLAARKIFMTEMNGTLNKILTDSLDYLSTDKEIDQYMKEYIKDRYYGLIEEDQDIEQISYLAARKIFMHEMNKGSVEQPTTEDMEKTVSFLQSEDLIADTSYENRSSNYFSKPLLVSLLLVLGWRIVYIFPPLFSSFSKSLIWGEDGIFEIIRKKSGKPKVSEDVASRHKTTFKELKKFTNQAEKVDEQLPKSKDFSLFVKFNQAVKQGKREYQKIFNIVQSVGESLIWGEDGIFEIIRKKSGKPKVPEDVASRHETTFKELKKFTNQAEKVDEQLPKSKDFSLFVKFNQAVKQGDREFKKLFNSVQLLKAALDTQNSFFKIEQIESRFCSYQQQEMYKFVEKNLSENINITEFRNSINNKLAEIIPLLNTDEGKQALQAYLKEINTISEHELGLKLFSLFKQYQLADYTILKKISDILSLLEGKDLLDRANLVNLVVENYQIFEKLSLILGVSQSKNSSDIHATILQYVALLYRHKDSYDKFEQLLNILKKWGKPYQTIVTLRQEYNSSNYRLPKEFFQPIPGLNIYKKYEKYVK
jgi:hypothetical protein